MASVGTGQEGMKPSPNAGSMLQLFTPVVVSTGEESWLVSETPKSARKRGYRGEPSSVMIH